MPLTVELLTTSMMGAAIFTDTFVEREAPLVVPGKRNCCEILVNPTWTPPTRSSHIARIELASLPSPTFFLEKVCDTGVAWPSFKTTFAKAVMMTLFFYASNHFAVVFPRVNICVSKESAERPLSMPIDGFTTGRGTLGTDVYIRLDLASLFLVTTLPLYVKVL